MILFVILGLMTAVAIGLLVFPLLRRQGDVLSRADYDNEIYRDQLAEIDRDVERGVINAEERNAARNEIKRRILATDTDPSGEKSEAYSKSGIIAGFAIMMAVPLAAGSLYLGLGSPQVANQPFAQREATVMPEAAMDGGPDVKAMVASLAERLADDPDDLEGWLMLGRSYGVMGSYQEAVSAFERARELSGDDPDILASLAENRVFAADGMVSPAAVADFETLQKLVPDHPAARFYLGLSHVQTGQYEVALDEWVSFARESPADAPWMETLKSQIAGVAETLGVSVPDDIDGMAVAAAPPGPASTPASASAAPGPSAEDIAAAQSMSADDQSVMIRSMVARLAARLEDEPGDIDGWRRLANAYGVLGDIDGAVEAYGKAAAQAPGDINLLSEFAEAITKIAPQDQPLPDAAVDIFEKIIALDGNSPFALWHLGLAAAEGGDRDKAVALWGRLLTLIPADSNDRNAVQRAIDSL